MQQRTSVDDVLDFAIAEEEGAVQFYTRLADTVENPSMREALLEFAAEEQAHKDKLLIVKAGGEGLREGEEAPVLDDELRDLVAALAELADRDLLASLQAREHRVIAHQHALIHVVLGMDGRE